MVHDDQLIDQLAQLPTSSFSGQVFRSTPSGRDGLAASIRAGRWMPANDEPVLYTSTEREGALAEASFHRSHLTPLPKKPIDIHTIRAKLERRLHLLEADLNALKILTPLSTALRYGPTQKLGSAVAFLGFDGLQIPSARWPCENVVIFANNHAGLLEIVSTDKVEWQIWARSNGFIA